MRKYISFIRIGALDSLAAGTNVIHWIVIDILAVGIAPIMWIAAMRARGAPIAGYDVAAIITYFIVAGCIWQMVVSYPFWYIIRSVRNGDLANDLVRPYSYFTMLFFLNAGGRFVRFFFVLPFLILFLIVFKSYLVYPAHVGTFFMFLASILVAFFLIYLIHFLVGLIVFWFEEGFAFADFFFLFFTFLSGDFAPLDFLPDWLHRIALALPFQYVLNFPLQIFLGKVNTHQFVTGFLTSLAWCAALYIVYRILWDRALRVFTAVGR